MTDSKPRVLVVDDDRAVRESLRRSLEFNGYDVVAGRRRRRGAGRASARSHPDVVVMDVMMPRLDGIETTRALRAAGNDVPILVLTARDAVGDRVEGLDAGRRRLPHQAVRARRSCWPGCARCCAASCPDDDGDERGAGLRRPDDGRRDAATYAAATARSS